MNSIKQPWRWVLFGILACAFGIRAWARLAGVPFAVEIDEPVVVDRALQIVQSGNWNPRGFDYPSLVVYLQACVTIVRFLWGAAQGLWSSLDNLDISALYDAGRLVAAGIGTATVWVTYRLGKELHSRSLGLVAAAELAVHPMHVRESHFVLTDVPATALVAVTILLAVRAAKRRTVSAYAAAGIAAGLATAAKYNGLVVAIVIALAWLLNERASLDRGRKAAVAIAGFVAAFLITVPYAVLELPGFLNGFGAQLARFAGKPRPPGADVPWRTYLMYLEMYWRYWIPLAGLGALIVLVRRRALTLWSIPAAFVLAYFYVLSSHSGVVFGRYALPLLPAICLFAAVPIVELARLVERRTSRSTAYAVIALGTVAMTVTFAIGSRDWLEQFVRPDTRFIAARWMTAAIPRMTRIATQVSGPTNLPSAGFEVVDQEVSPDDRVDAYARTGVQYLVIAPFSSSDLARYDGLMRSGRVVFSVDPSDKRWGPFVRVVQVSPN